MSSLILSAFQRFVDKYQHILNTQTPVISLHGYCFLCKFRYRYAPGCCHDDYYAPTLPPDKSLCCNHLLFWQKNLTHNYRKKIQFKENISYILITGKYKPSSLPIATSLQPEKGPTKARDLYFPALITSIIIFLKHNLKRHILCSLASKKMLITV